MRTAQHSRVAAHEADVLDNAEHFAEYEWQDSLKVPHNPHIDNEYASSVNG